MEKRSVYWGRLSNSAPAKARHAPPEPYETRYWIPAVILAVAVAVMGSGSIGGGLLLLAAAVAGFGWVWRGNALAGAARTRWERELYCTHCDHVFVPAA